MNISELKKTYNYSIGAIHIHSKFSDGSGDIEQITKAAKKAGLDWIIITDHNVMEVKEGVYNGVCLIVGEEISPKESYHYLALGINKVISPEIGVENYVHEVHKSGGFGFAAHPDEADSRKNKARPIKWLDKTISPDGIEIWNWFSNWADNYNSSNIFSIAYGYFFRNNLIKGPHVKTLKWWDDLNKTNQKIITAVGGVDAHALKINKYIVPVTVFPYEFMFKTIANVIPVKENLPDSFEAKKEFILNALKSGKNIIINKSVKNINPLIIYEDRCIQAEFDFEADFRIICNGEFIVREKTKKLNFPVKNSGKYRVEVYYNGKPWIYTNYFIVNL